VTDLGFRVQGAWCRVRGFGFRLELYMIHGIGFMVQGWGLRV
jgi:hypothetical protein